MKRILALILSLSLLLVGCAPQVDLNEDPDTDDAVKSAAEIKPVVDVSYPEMAQYPNELLTEGLDFDNQYSAWRQDRNTQRQFPGRGEGVDDFTKISITRILSSDDNKNLVYSPINVYMALGMLAELTDGASRSQILELLGEESIEALRESAKGVWNNNYCDDGALASILASSVWVDNGVALIEDTAKTLADNYYSEIYSCSVGSPEMLKVYKAWLNEQTGGLLEDIINDTQIDPDTILALATTVYFRAKWSNEFIQQNNTTETFNTANGAVQCEFMHESRSGIYYYSENFAAVKKDFHDGGSMWFILPDEGVTLNSLVSDEAALDLIVNSGANCESAHVIINMSVPKFDVKSDIDLKQNLIDLGISDVFDKNNADFSNLSASTNGEVWLDKVKHAARVAIDEEGVTAAAYTEMMLLGNSLPPNETVDFILDRPFMFAITGATGDIMFVGTVNDPIA